MHGAVFEEVQREITVGRTSGLLVMEAGVGNIVEETYPYEEQARAASRKLWCSWVLYSIPSPSVGGAPREVLSGGLGFSHNAIRRHVAATRPSTSHRAPTVTRGLSFTDACDSSPSSSRTAVSRYSAAGPVAPPLASPRKPMRSDAEVGSLLVGWLEKKPVHGLGMLERSAGGGWRTRRVVLRHQSLEWRHGGDDSEGEVQVLLLQPVGTRVRASGDAGDDEGRCLTVSGTVLGEGVTLVLRCADTNERDAWVRAVTKCVEALKAAAFDAAVAVAQRKLDAIRLTHGDDARKRGAVREGVRLLMERFFSASSVQAATEEAFEIDVTGLASALHACLLTRQAEARVRARVRRRAADGRELQQTDDELRELRLFPWQPLVARRFEDATWQLVHAWGGARCLARTACIFDHALGISEAFQLSPQAAAHGDVGPWSTYRDAVHTSIMHRLVLLAISPPAELIAFADQLDAHYETLPTNDDLRDAGTRSVLTAVDGSSCEILTRISSSKTTPLLIQVHGATPADEAASAAPHASRAEEGAAAPSAAPLAPPVLTPVSEADAAEALAKEAACAAPPGPSDEGTDEVAPSAATAVEARLEHAACEAASAPAASAPPSGLPRASLRHSARYIFKKGDDLMQDVLVLMMLDEMNVLWREAGSQAFASTYSVVPTGERSGFIELLPNAISVKAVAEFKYSPSLHNSAVGAFIGGFVLGLADRHQDNMLLVGPAQDTLAHIDFGYVAGAVPWFDANLLPIPQRFMRCCAAAGKWTDFVNDCGFAYAILQSKRAEIFAIAQTFAEPLLRVGYPAYIDNTLGTHSADAVRALVEAAPNDLSRRFKNLHHSWSHREGTK